MRSRPILAAVVLLGATACSSTSAASTTEQSSSTSLPELEGQPVTVSTVTASTFDGAGDAQSICDAAIVEENPNHYDFSGIVVQDTTMGSTRWLFCIGDPASGQGLVALATQDSQHWLFAALGFGSSLHAGDSSDATVLDTQRAAVTYDSMMPTEHEHAFTVDGGQMWRVLSTRSD